MTDENINEKREDTVIKQIIAMGGGGFTMETINTLLDDYVLRSSNREKPKICFLPTASGDNPEYIGMFYNSFLTRHCQPSHLELSNPPSSDMESFLLEQDIIYVGGGHTSRMLSMWKTYGVDKILKKAWDMGILIAGVSSGSACWFEEAVTDSVPGSLTPEKCLGFLKGSHCAHYDNPERRPAFHKYIRTGAIRSGIGVDNFAALHFFGIDLKRVVCSQPHATAYYVRKTDDRTEEKKLYSYYLGDYC